MPASTRTGTARRAIAVVAVAALALNIGGVAPAATNPTAEPAARTTTTQRLQPDTRASCAETAVDRASCPVLASDAAGGARTVAAARTAGIEPLTAADLQSAYRLPSTLLGARQTIAVISAFDYSTAAVDLAVYRAEMGLPACDADFPCLRKVNQRGEDTPPPAASPDWALGGAITLQMASATCPNCHLLLVQADSDTLADLGAAVDTAAELGADVIVPMYLELEGAFVRDDAVHYDHPRSVIVAPAGHGAFGNGVGRQYVPAAYPTVISVGGTTLYRDSSARGWGERVWASTSSGCSAYLLKPAWQRRGACGDKRTVTDVAAVADPSSPVAVYDTHGYSGWLALGGTGIPPGIIAGAYALAGNTDTIDPGQHLARNAGHLFDITTGANGNCGDPLCTATTGYDGPSGYGSPNGIGAF